MKALTLVAMTCLATPLVAEERTMTVAVWADNWFSFYANGELVGEDSVPITTERSFNSESFRFAAELPMQVAIMAKDFKENDTGLEYIGTRRQQMGDGGLIAQLTDFETGNRVAITTSAMRCLVIHEAPLDTACAVEPRPEAGTAPCEFTASEPPEGWTDPDFDDSAWPMATVHSADAVDPKHGYLDVTWDSGAVFVWGGDLERDNTILCRAVIDY